jgi:hypothetical protein
MTEIGAMQIKDILGNEFVHPSNQDKIDFFFIQDEFGESFFERMILNNAEQIESLFNSELLCSLDNELIGKIFSTKINNKEILLNFVCNERPEVLGILLQSKTFAKLTTLEQKEILKIRSDSNSMPLIIKAVEKANQICISNILNTESLLKLEEEKIFELLDDKDIQRKNVLHKAARKSSEHFKIVMDSRLFNQLSTEYKFTLLANQDDNMNSLLFSLITTASKKPNQNYFNVLFLSRAFNEFDDAQQKSLLYLGQEGNSKKLWYNLIKKQNIIKLFIGNEPKFLVSDFIEFIKNYYWEDCCLGDRVISSIREKISFLGLLEIAKASSLYGNAVDANNFSVLYYLASYGMAINELQRYQKDYGFEIITKESYEVIIRSQSILLTYKNATRDVLFITGQYTNNDILSGLEAAMHQSGFNILLINANFIAKGKDSDIKNIVADYPRKEDINFIIINAHGNPKDLENSDVVFFIYDRGNKTPSKVLFEKIVIPAIGTNNPLDIFLTSCNGQLATKNIHKILPINSKMITVGERIDDIDHSTQVIDIQNMAKAIYLYRSIVNINYLKQQYTLEKMLIDYLMHLHPSNSTKGIPTYTKIGNSQSLSIIDLKPTKNCIIDLKVEQKTVLKEMLCTSQDHKCVDNLEEVLLSWNQTKISGQNSIVLLQDSRMNMELGVVSAIKFVDNLYCQNTFGHEPMEQNKDFCCGNDNTNLFWYFYGTLATAGLASTIAYCLYDNGAE